MEKYFERKYNKISGFGHFAITNLSDKITKEDFILSDMLCYYIGELFKEDKLHDSWFPSTYLYNQRNSFDFFDKLSSERHFQKIKGIFDVKTPVEFKNLIHKYAESMKDSDRIRYGRGDEIPFLHEVIPTDKIGMNR